MKIIEIIVSPDGQIKVQTRGFSGSTCKDAGRQLEEALGAKLEETLTSEFYRSETATVNRQQTST